MKLVIAFALCVVAALAAPAAPADKPEPIPIVRSDFQQQPDGAYNFGYETGDGIQRSENGEVKEVKDEEDKPRLVVVIRGSYSYNDPDGKPVNVNYYADETGFHADSEIIPKNKQ